MGRILLLLDHPGTRRLLSTWLTQYDDVQVAQTDILPPEPFDLVLLDIPVVERHWQAIDTKRHAAAPVLLPHLLVVPRQQLELITRHLGHTVDEVLCMPIDKTELRARVEVLLRMRQQSQELKQHNDELAAFLEARQALERMQDEFIATASHELRTPLTSIKGYVSLLLDGEVGALTAAQQDFLVIVNSNTERLINLVNDLLDFSRIEAGHLHLTRGHVDLCEVARRVGAELRTLAASKHISTVMDLPSAPMWIYADQDRIIQVLTNLLSNAYKYTPTDAAVTLRISVQGAFAQVDVVDQGIGIALPDQERLFTRFFRADSAKHHGISGTGLGLSITRSLVEMHGGQIWVASALGQGSTFSCTLPLVTSAPDTMTPHHT